MPTDVKINGLSRHTQELVNSFSKRTYAELLRNSNNKSELSEFVKEATLEARTLMGGDDPIPVEVYYDKYTKIQEKVLFMTVYFSNKTMAQYWEEHDKFIASKNPTPPSAPNMPADSKQGSFTGRNDSKRSGDEQYNAPPAYRAASNHIYGFPDPQCPK